MSFKNLFIPLIIVYGLLFTFTGCGYKPSSYYAKGAIEGKVFVDVVLNIKSSNNATYIKDEVNKMVLNRFKGELTDDKKSADSIILINLKSISHSAIVTDSDGYIKTYRATVNAAVTYRSKDDDFKSVSFSDYHDYSIDSSSVISTSKKNEAVRIASMKAISNLFSKIAVRNTNKVK